MAFYLSFHSVQFCDFIVSYKEVVATRFFLRNVVSVLVTVLAESINQFGFQFRYWTETKIAVWVVHYKEVFFHKYIDGVTNLIDCNMYLNYDAYVEGWFVSNENYTFLAKM